MSIFIDENCYGAESTAMLFFFRFILQKIVLASLLKACSVLGCASGVAVLSWVKAAEPNF